MLLALIATAWAAMSDFYVESLPGAESIKLPDMYSGTLELPSKGGTEPMFFWLYESKYRTTVKPKTLIWLNGGPGCSSLDGALLELGPIRFEGKDRIKYNEGNWGEYLNILYLDQPFGTGYSFLNDSNDAVSNVEEAATRVNQFLESWLEIFPQHSHDDFYFGGESYAGQYIPYIQRSLTAIDLKGIILANPWIDAAHQYLSYMPFVKEHGLIEPHLYPELEKLHKDCANALQTYEKIPSSVPVCDTMTNFITSHYSTKGSCFNVYNYKLEDVYPACGMNWPEGVTDMPAYLDRTDVRQALHVPLLQESQKWDECSGLVHRKFRNFDKPTASTLLPQILSELPVLIMVGDLDFICNYNGLSDMISTMSWGGWGPSQRGWAPFEELMNITLHDNLVGDVIQGRNLTFARISDGTHMIPVDKQWETRAIVHWFTGITDSIRERAPLDSYTPFTDWIPAYTESQEATEARKSAYKRAGITALVVVTIMVAVLMLWLWHKGDVHLSWQKISSGFARALLHVGTPRIRRTFEYVSLDTFRPSGVPSTIVEEEEEEDGFTV